MSNVEELDALLDRLHSEHEDRVPALAVLESPGNGDSLAIGLGRPLSVLNFVPGSGEPPYFTSLGFNEGDQAIEFEFMGELSEYPIKNAVPIDVARQAFRDFFKTGELTKNLRWEQD